MQIIVDVLHITYTWRNDAEGLNWMVFEEKWIDLLIW